MSAAQGLTGAEQALLDLALDHMREGVEPSQLVPALFMVAASLMSEFVVPGREQVLMDAAVASLRHYMVASLRPGGSA